VTEAELLEVKTEISQLLSCQPDDLSVSSIETIDEYFAPEKEKVLAEIRKKAELADDFAEDMSMGQKRILMYVGITVIMAALMVFWFNSIRAGIIDSVVYPESQQTGSQEYFNERVLPSYQSLLEASSESKEFIQESGQVYVDSLKERLESDVDNLYEEQVKDEVTSKMLEQLENINQNTLNQ